MRYRFYLHYIDEKTHSQQITEPGFENSQVDAVFQL